MFFHLVYSSSWYVLPKGMFSSYNMHPCGWIFYGLVILYILLSNIFSHWLALPIDMWFLLVRSCYLVHSTPLYVLPSHIFSHWLVLPIDMWFLLERSCYFVHFSPCYSMFFSLVYSSFWYVLPMCMLFHLVCSPYVYVLPFICLSIDIFSLILPHIMIFHLIFSSSWCVLIWIFPLNMFLLLIIFSPWYVLSLRMVFSLIWPFYFLIVSRL